MVPDRRLPRPNQDIVLCTFRLSYAKSARAGHRSSRLKSLRNFLSALRTGSYIKPACEASGIRYPTLRTWIQRGEADKAAGRSTEYA
jgi:hypothetical protein